MSVDVELDWRGRLDFCSVPVDVMGMGRSPGLRVTSFASASDPFEVEVSFSDEEHFVRLRLNAQQAKTLASALAFLEAHAS